MRWNISSHTYGDTSSTVYQKVWISRRKNGWFFFCFVKVWNKIHSIFADILYHHHGNFAKSCFCVTHRSCAVTVHRTEVSVTVYEWTTEGPWLSHVYKCSINRAVTMWVIFTHGVTNDTRTLTMWLIWSIVQFNHRVKYSTLNWFQTISYIR